MGPEIQALLRLPVCARCGSPCIVLLGTNVLPLLSLPEHSPWQQGVFH
jgi:hypothetical protein